MRSLIPLLLFAFIAACDSSTADDASENASTVAPTAPVQSLGGGTDPAATTAVEPQTGGSAGTASTSSGGAASMIPTATEPGAGGAPPVEVTTPVKERLGLQLYSLRTQLAQDLPGTLTLVKEMGFTRVEAYDLHGQTALGLRTLLDERQLTVGGFSAPFERIESDPEGVLADAKVLGAPVVSCAWIPHVGQYTAATNQHAIEVFTKIGQLAQADELRFLYHPHGYEFHPGGIGERLIDQMIQQTEPGVVDFEMDVFWVVHGGGDPVAYLERYPGRFPLFHMKDMKEGTPVGLTTAAAPQNSNVQLGTGVIDMAAIIRAAEQHGEPFYYIEDESDSVVQTLPNSLAYLQNLEL